MRVRSIISASGLLAAIGLLIAPGVARADVDLTGEWEILTSVEGVVEAFDVTVTQSGTMLTIDLYPYGPLSGSIDPVSGVFTIDALTPACDGFYLAGIATPDGASFTGAAGRQWLSFLPLPFCGTFFGDAIGARAACGNQIPGPSEVCDDGNTADGDCCTSACDAVAPSGTICRPSTHGCDAAETCYGGGGPCPPDSGSSDFDGDGRCNGADPCEGGAVATRARLATATHDATAGDDRLKLKGTFTFPYSPVFNPVADGARVAIYDGADQPLADVTVPGGAYNPLTRAGWKVSANGYKFRWKSPTPAGGLLTGVALAGVPGPSGEVRFRIKGKQGTWASAPVALPLSAVVALDPAQPLLDCGQATFATCTLDGATASVSCR